LGSIVKFLMIAILTIVAVTQSSCVSMWQRVRERERVFAVESARSYAQKGNCDAALRRVDRAQSRLNLGTYARESTLIRTGCYEKLGHEELAIAHRQLLTDFYENEPVSVLGPDRVPMLRVADADLVLDHYSRPPSALKLSSPRYDTHAQRSGIVGRVVISFDLSKAGRPVKIRVLEMPHPLLATWAIEALVETRLKKSARRSVLPGERYVTTFQFEWRWAEKAESGQDS
jgi:hypothetical protein